MENNQWYDRQDLTTGWPFLEVLWLVGSFVRTGQLDKVIESSQGYNNEWMPKIAISPDVWLMWKFGWLFVSIYKNKSRHRDQEKPKTTQRSLIQKIRVSGQIDKNKKKVYTTPLLSGPLWPMYV